MHGNVLEWCQDWFARYGSDKIAYEQADEDDFRKRIQVSKSRKALNITYRRKLTRWVLYRQN